MGIFFLGLCELFFIALAVLMLMAGLWVHFAAAATIVFILSLCLRMMWQERE